RQSQGSCPEEGVRGVSEEAAGGDSTEELEVAMRPWLLIVLSTCFAASRLAAPHLAGSQDVPRTDAGRGTFEARRGRCHGADANGGDMGPAITARLAEFDDQHLTALIHDGLPGRGMPPTQLSSAEAADLLKYLRTLERRAERIPPRRLQVQTTGGGTL